MSEHVAEEIMKRSWQVEREVLGLPEPAPGKAVAVPFPTEDQRATIQYRLRRWLQTAELPGALDTETADYLEAWNYHEAAAAVDWFLKEGER